MEKEQISPLAAYAKAMGAMAESLAQCRAAIEGPDKDKFILFFEKGFLGVRFEAPGQPRACAPYSAALYQRPADCPREVRNGFNELARPVRLDAACAANAASIAECIKFLAGKNPALKEA